MSTAITENISENDLSPIGDKSSRRGRPALMDAETEAVYVACGLFSANAPRRSKMNVFYRQRALATLGDGYEWLFDKEKIMATGEGMQHTVLTELGRIEDEELLRAVAAQLCEMKPKTRDAVLMVRKVRIGELPSGDTLQLANEIISTVNRYLHSHAKVTKQDVIDALLTAHGSVEESLN